MRIVFAGTPDTALPALRALSDGPHDVVTVLTRPDAPVGRRRELMPSAVADLAERLQIPVLKTRRIAEDTIEHVQSLQADLGVVVAFGALLPEPLLQATTFGWINIHFSLLPRWRGAAPLQRALIAGDDELGVTLFRLDQGLDTGPVLASRSVHNTRLHTAGGALAELAVVGAQLLTDALVNDPSGWVTTDQFGPATTAPKLQRSDGLLDWQRPAAEVMNRFLGVTPEPGAFTTAGTTELKVLELREVQGAQADAQQHTPGHVFREGQRVFVRAADRPLELLRVQVAGKQPIDASAWLRGQREQVVFGA